MTDTLRGLAQEVCDQLDKVGSVALGDLERLRNVLAADAPEGPYQMDAVDDIPSALKDRIGRAVADEVARQDACGEVDYFQMFRAGLGPCREKLNQLVNGENDA